MILKVTKHSVDGVSLTETQVDKLIKEKQIILVSKNMNKLVSDMSARKEFLQKLNVQHIYVAVPESVNRSYIEVLNIGDIDKDSTELSRLQHVSDAYQVVDIS